MRRFSFAVGVALLLASSANAQFQAAGVDPNESTDAVFPGTAFALEAFQAKHEGSWILRDRHDIKAGRFLYGGKLAPAFAPSTEADFAALSWSALEQANDMFRIAPETLQVSEVRVLPLSRGGLRDKVAVNMVQVHNGVPVVGGHVDFLFHTDGHLVGLDSLAFPGVEQLSTDPVISADRAVREAIQAFSEIEEMFARTNTEGQLVIYPDQSGKLAEPRLAWAIEVWNRDNTLPAGRRIYVAADTAAGTILGNDQLVHECGFEHGSGAAEEHVHTAVCAHDHEHDAAAPVDFVGHVDSWATPGILPDTASNPEVVIAMPYLRVNSSAGSVQTDINGDFVLPYSGTSPLDLTFEYRGTYCRIYNQAGATYSYTQTFTPGVADNALMNDERTQQSTAHANVFKSVVDMREWLVSVDPSDDTLEFQVRANVNINNNCNAFFDGSSINFYVAGSNCVNTAYSTVSAHEEGHWLNVLYSSGNGSDGFGEGAADIWAMFLYDTPIVGENFCGNGCNIRTGTNTRQYCGSGCYGQVHTDGEVLMGAFWKWRENLNASLGNAAGDLVADTLCIAWFNAYNDGQILPVIEDHLLALDDDDGNIGNGTPNFTEIDNGFRAQGFPGVDLDYIAIVHAELGDTQNEAGPYVVEANLAPQFGSSINFASVKYSVDGGATQTVPMTPLGGNDYIATIPGQVSPAQVIYWIEAEDDLGNTDRYPKKTDAGFLVGLRRIAYFSDFETPGDDGWSHEYGGGTSNSHDDWQHDSPKGNGGDPSSAYSGNLVWANDVGNSGWNGLYQSNVNNRLISPAIDCTNYSGLRLRFARWLTVESGQYDQARVRVAGNIIWTNDNNSDTIDTAWQVVDYDVSSFADGNPSVIMRWELRTDGGTEFGGWTVDDVMLYSLEASGATDTILLTGDTAPTAGSTADYQFTNGPAGGDWFLVYSPNLNGGSYKGHPFDVGNPVTIAASGSFDEKGNGSLNTPIPANAAGATVYLEVAGIDSEGFVTDSNPLQITIQ